MCKLCRKEFIISTHMYTLSTKVFIIYSDRIAEVSLYFKYNTVLVPAIAMPVLFQITGTFSKYRHRESQYCTGAQL